MCICVLFCTQVVIRYPSFHCVYDVERKDIELVLSPALLPSAQLFFCSSDIFFSFSLSPSFFSFSSLFSHVWFDLSHCVGWYVCCEGKAVYTVSASCLCINICDSFFVACCASPLMGLKNSQCFLVQDVVDDDGVVQV